MIVISVFSLRIISVTIFGSALFCLAKDGGEPVVIIHRKSCHYYHTPPVAVYAPRSCELTVIDLRRLFAFAMGFVMLAAPEYVDVEYHAPAIVADRVAFLMDLVNGDVVDPRTPYGGGPDVEAIPDVSGHMEELD